MSDIGDNFGTKLERIISGIFMGGAIFIEVVFDLDATDFVDLAIVDPLQARFQRRHDEVRGQYWQLGKEENGLFSPITDPTITYRPINAIPGRPFGRPLANSAIFPLVFLLGLMKSARQVIEAHAWPRGFWSCLLYTSPSPRD